MKHHEAKITFDNDLVTKEDLTIQLVVLRQQLILSLGGIVAGVGGLILAGVRMMLP